MRSRSYAQKMHNSADATQLYITKSKYAKIEHAFFTNIKNAYLDSINKYSVESHIQYITKRKQIQYIFNFSTKTFTT